MTSEYAITSTACRADTVSDVGIVRDLQVIRVRVKGLNR